VSFCANQGTKKGEYSCASEDVDVVKMGENVDDEFRRKVLDGGMHIIWGGWNLWIWRMKYE